MRMLIADTLALARKGLKGVLLEAFPEAYIEETDDPAEIVDKARQGPWRLIVSDIAMPGHYGMEILHTVRRQFPDIPILIMSIYPEEQYARRILQCGVNGYLSKRATPQEVVTAVKNVMQGKKYISPHVADRLINDLLLEHTRPPHDLLSNREFDIFKLLASGKKVTEIAHALSLSGTMVGNYRARIFTKMNLKNNAELILYASTHNLT
ncbi:MAG: response regulator transcription factor [Bacteroidetes bacterium]|nr:response regulator transcription factor [Bacteroidota bacterium]